MLRSKAENCCMKTSGMIPPLLPRGMLLRRNTNPTMGPRKVGKRSRSINLPCELVVVPIVGSPLYVNTHEPHRWYNMPPSPLKEGLETNHTEDSIVSSLPTQKNVPGTNDQEDSTPLDFDTFVPSHNPSLDLPFNSSSAPGIDYTSHSVLKPPGTIPDEDEAFTRALGAMYWGGYWTAVYHVNHPLFTSLQSLTECFLTVPKI